tara:strand:- start:407401 stop:407610 length:210 start_codon:yes stop_codon:yes gene_type:complete
MQTHDKYLTAAQAADLLSVSTRTVLKLLSESVLVGFRTGGASGDWRVLESSVIDFISKNSNQPQPETAG